MKNLKCYGLALLVLTQNALAFNINGAPMQADYVVHEHETLRVNNNGESFIVNSAGEHFGARMARESEPQICNDIQGWVFKKPADLKLLASWTNTPRLSMRAAHKLTAYCDKHPEMDLETASCKATAWFSFLC